MYFQYKEMYHSKIRDLCHRLKQQQQNFSTQEKILHQRATQAAVLPQFVLDACVCIYCISSVVWQHCLADRKGIKR